MSRCHSDVILGQQPSQSTVAPVSSQASHCRCQTRTGAGDVDGQRPACSPAPLAPHTALGARPQHHVRPSVRRPLLAGRRRCGAAVPPPAFPTWSASSRPPSPPRSA